MKIVRVEGNLVVEIIPEEARPVAEWYNETFARQCVEAPDEVQTNWTYDPKTGTFSYIVYNKGDIYNYNGALYKSLMDGNVYPPEAYPAGWELCAE